MSGERSEEPDDDAEYFYGSCERCGCNLTDAGEAMDGVCDQCSWWISQCCEEQRP